MWAFVTTKALAVDEVLFGGLEEVEPIDERFGAPRPVQVEHLPAASASEEHVGEFEVGRLPGMKHGIPIDGGFAWTLGVPLPADARMEFRMTLNGGYPPSTEGNAMPHGMPPSCFSWRPSR